jgi:protein-arginine kinase activator protein McsA
MAGNSGGTETTKQVIRSSRPLASAHGQAVEHHGLTPEQLKEMTPSEKLCYVLNSINLDFTDEDFDRVIDLVDEINDKKKK